MNKGLDYYINTLTQTFKKNQPRIAHALSRELLLEMAKDKKILLEIIDRTIKSKDFFLKLRINPVIAMTVVDNPYITLIAHFWMPLADRDTTITHQSIHHHGRLLLTSVAPYGPGYESIIFKKGFTIDPETEVASIQIDKEYTNTLFNLEYIETDTPHVVFFPKELSITYALWTYDQRSFVDKIRKNTFLQKYKKIILSILNYAKGISPKINTIEYFDFFPSGSHIVAMKERVKYPAGSNANFIQNVFYILQQIGYSNYETLKKTLNNYPEQTKQQALECIRNIEAGIEIQDLFDPIHLNIEKINFSKESLKNGLIPNLKSK